MRIRWRLKRLLAEIGEGIIEQSNEPFQVRLRRVCLLTENLVELANEMLEEEIMETQVVRIAAKLPPAHDERKRRRGRLLELGMEAYEELRQISGSEEAAKEAEFRMHAYQVMARVGAFNAAIIRDQEAEELAQMIADLEEGNDRLEQSMKEIEEELGIAGKRKKEEDGRGC